MGVDEFLKAMNDGLRDPQALHEIWHEGAKREVHTIPVPSGWSTEQAWEAISRGDELTDPEPAWANIEVVNDRLVRVL